jgi:hypothetical protein
MKNSSIKIDINKKYKVPIEKKDRFNNKRDYRQNKSSNRKN